MLESISAMSCTLIGANLTQGSCPLVHCSVGMKLVVTKPGGCNRRSSHMVRGIHSPPLILQLI